MRSAEQKNKGWYPVFLIVFCLLVALDQWTKHLALTLKSSGEPFILIPGVLEFRYLENRGAAFSMLQGKQVFFYVLTTVFLVVILYVLWKTPRTRKMLPLSIGLIVLAAGAVGNLIDRVIHQYVVDFIYFSLIDFPIFNVADIYVTLSVIALAILILFKYKDGDFDYLHRKSRPDEEKAS